MSLVPTSVVKVIWIVLSRTSAMSSAPEELPVACTLGPDPLRIHIEQWRALLAHVERRTPLDDGLRVELAPETPLPELMRLVAAEQHCCQFLRFAITADTRGIGMEVRGPADARPLIESVFAPAA